MVTHPCYLRFTTKLASPSVQQLIECSPTQVDHSKLLNPSVDLKEIKNKAVQSVGIVNDLIKEVDSLPVLTENHSTHDYCKYLVPNNINLYASSDKDPPILSNLSPSTNNFAPARRRVRLKYPEKDKKQDNIYQLLHKLKINLKILNSRPPPEPITRSVRSHPIRVRRPPDKYSPPPKSAKPRSKFRKKIRRGYRKIKKQPPPEPNTFVEYLN